MGISGIPKPKPLEIKFYTIDYVHEVTQCTRNGLNRLRGAALNESEMYAFWDTVHGFSFFYMQRQLQSTDLGTQ